MAATTGSTYPVTRSPQMVTAVYVPAAQTFYVGDLVGIDRGSSGRVKAWTDTSGANLDFLGMSLDALTGDNSTRNLRVSESGDTILRCSVAGATSASNGRLVYSASNNYADFTLTPTTNAKSIGRIVRAGGATDCDVQLHTPRQYIGVRLP